jgi:thiol-disulfide isomerase/thioredoxin
MDTAKIKTSKKNIVPIVVLVAIIIAGTFAVLFSRTKNADDIIPKANVNNLPVISKSVPELDTSLGWLNTKGVTKDKLDSSVVIYDFWTYSCVNCQRTIPYLQAIYDRYEKDGLIIVGVHSPEFDFEKVHSNVEDATNKYKVNWPVLFDDDMKNWDKFENRFWPAKYITDKKGQLRYSHFGEGRYDETEDIVRKLLDIKDGEPRAKFPGENGETSQAKITPELYLNPIRGTSNAKAGKQEIEKVVIPELNNVTYFGSISTQAQRTILVKPDAKLLLNYQAAEVNLVAENLDKDTKMISKLKVELDGKPIPSGVRGKAIKIDEEGNTYVEVTTADLLNIIDADKVNKGILTFTALQPRIALYSFTFGA